MHIIILFTYHERIIHGPQKVLSSSHQVSQPQHPQGPGADEDSKHQRQWGQVILSQGSILHHGRGCGWYILCRGSLLVDDSTLLLLLSFGSHGCRWDSIELYEYERGEVMKS
jgi:hypothetical protein